MYQIFYWKWSRSLAIHVYKMSWQFEHKCVIITLKSDKKLYSWLYMYQSLAEKFQQPCKRVLAVLHVLDFWWYMYQISHIYTVHTTLVHSCRYISLTHGHLVLFSGGTTTTLALPPLCRPNTGRLDDTDVDMVHFVYRHWALFTLRDNTASTLYCTSKSTVKLNEPLVFSSYPSLLERHRLTQIARDLSLDLSGTSRC